MSIPMQHILRHLFNTANLEDVPRTQLEELVEEYPSFGVARYLLSRKLRAEGDEHFTDATLKTNLYFSNPYWLQWLLQEGITTTPATGRTFIADEPVSEPPADVQLTEEAPAIGHNPETDELSASRESSADQREEHTTVEQAIPHTGDEQPQAITEIKSKPNDPVAPQEVLSAEPLAPVETPHSAADDIMRSIAELRNSQQEAAETEQTAVPEEQETPVSLVSMTLEQAEGTFPGDTAPDIDPDGPLSTDTPDHPANGIAIDTPAANGDQDAPAVTAETEVQPPAVQSVTTAEPIVTFEPYYTIDYFASQGIRLTLDENPKDKLGKQLKSFTEWLKVMRKLPQKNQEIIPDIAAEHQVRAIAAHSIEGKEVLTETMAEVLAKQGMREKASEVYRKLSLLNPDKSSYFAKKIEQLKIY